MSPHPDKTFRIVRNRRSVRLLHGRNIVSMALARPQASHSLFDVMAACIPSLSPGPRVALLGFGYGAVLAPLRALLWPHAVDAVDLSSEGLSVLRSIAGRWIEPLRFARAEASAWLARRRRRHDMIVVDLSMPVAGDLVMPDVCFIRLPALIPRRLTHRGVVVFNAFSPGSLGWRSLIERLQIPGYDTRIIIPKDFDHRIVILGRRLPRPRTLSKDLRANLAIIRSRQSRRVSVAAMS
ncbi:MAG: class I SAM-dependent methyltransferase [Vicinamibacteria bacterium]|nr:class I SAM-dependent methyltransferase [Vicinamibacteria bacterium]